MTGRLQMPIAAESALETARQAAAACLLGERSPAGCWVGELSSSALSTATAVCALELARRADPSHDTVRRAATIRRGLAWLVDHQNADGGWGDTVASPSNVSTTVLAWVALGLDPEPTERDRPRVERAEARLRRWVGDLAPTRLAEHLLEVYGDDRTFSIPILTTCALGGRFGSGETAWRSVPQVPFELAAVPSRWFGRLGLPMVSYALPALIAMGQVRHRARPVRNPLLRRLRDALRGRTLAVLRRLQPAGGGFLEAVPLTSFVAMSLIGAGEDRHPAVEDALGFLDRSVRTDGSWPIDSDLGVWLTSLAVGALAHGGRLDEHLGAGERAALADCLLARQHLERHPYTGTSPGGWAWTAASGGVPDADDTAAALLALRALAVDGIAGSGGGVPAERIDRVAAGVGWLLDLQNRDGGIPTFCRGWGHLPFDRSSPDLTAHAVRAWAAWWELLPAALRSRVTRATRAAIAYLLAEQRADGTWIPLWFGNQHEPDLANPVYGTARVLLASSPCGLPGLLDGALEADWRRAVERGGRALVALQHADGGWGGGASSPSTLEETGLAVTALAGRLDGDEVGSAIEAAIEAGVDWIAGASAGGRRFEPSPIGLYFAKLWYAERLYPLVFSVAALEAASSASRP